MHAHTSPRTFARWFSDTTGTTPYNWLLRQRVQLAQHLLETSDLPVDLIAKNTGLSDAGNLRKHFARQLHTTPAAYRKAFHGPPSNDTSDIASTLRVTPSAAVNDCNSASRSIRLAR